MILLLEINLIGLILIVVVAFGKNYYGHIGATFYNFEDYTLMDFSEYQSFQDYDPDYVPSNISDFRFNFGTPAKVKDIISIGIIQYYINYHYSDFYPISPAKSWDIEDVGNDIIFQSNYTQFKVPRSDIQIGPKNETPQLIFVFSCSKYLGGLRFDSTLNYTDPYFYYLYIKGDSSNCFKIFNVISYIFSTCKYIVCPIVIILGSALAFTGLKYFRLSIAICEFVALSMISFLIFPWGIDDINQRTIHQSIMTICSTVIVPSFILSLLSIKIFRLGLFFLGLTCGGVLILIIYNTLFHSIYSDIILYVISSICALIGGVMSCRINPIIIIFSTPIIGSYLIIRGIAGLIGGYPNEIMIYTMIRSGVEFQYSFYAYLAAILILAFVSLIIQVKTIGKNADRQSDNYQNEDANQESVQYVFIRYVAII